MFCSGNTHGVELLSVFAWHGSSPLFKSHMGWSHLSFLWFIPHTCLLRGWDNDSFSSFPLFNHPELWLYILKKRIAYHFIFNSSPLLLNTCVAAYLCQPDIHESVKVHRWRTYGTRGHLISVNVWKYVFTCVHCTSHPNCELFEV